QLRDDVVHLTISQVPPDIMGLFQAAVINYHNMMLEWFNKSLSNQIPVGMMAIVYAFSPDQFDPSTPRLRKSMGRESADYLLNIRRDISEEFENLGRSSEFCIHIDYRLALVKTPGQADITFSTGDSGVAAQKIYVARDPAVTHPYRTRE